MGLFQLVSKATSVLTTPLTLGDYLSVINPRFSGKQLRAVVTRVDREGENSATISFKPGPGWRPHVAGQWARIGVEIDGVRHWRSYSLSAPAGGSPAITVTAIGRVSSALVHDTRPGDVLLIDPPQGEFVLPEHPRPLLMLTAGSGITPVMSMVRTLVTRREDADVVLLHSARTRDEALFADELDALASAHPGLRVVRRITSTDGRLDFSSTADLDALAPDWRTRDAYACGPASFLEAAEALWQANPDGRPLRLERFTPVTFDGPAGEGGRVTFTRSDIEADAPGSAPLLEVGEDAGVLMRSGCRMGICRTCLTPLAAGRVRDLTTGAVTDEPGELIRTCVSAAAGDVQLEC